MADTRELTLDHVYVTQDGLSGQSPDVLDDLYCEMIATDTGMGVRGLISEIRQRHSSSPDETRELLGPNTYLATVQEGPDTAPDRVPDGVLYAESSGTGDNPETEGFSVVRMGLWLRHDPNAAYSCDPRTQQLTRRVVDAVLHDVTTSPLPTGIHIPVNQKTVLDSHPVADNAMQLEAPGWTYGRRQTTYAVDALQVPNTIKGLFMASSAAAYEVGDSNVPVELNTIRLMQLIASLTPEKTAELLEQIAADKQSA